MKLFVTYGCGSNLNNCFSVVEGDDLSDCRRKVFEGTNGKHAFTYTEEQFDGQVEQWGLREVALQPQGPVGPPKAR